MCPYVEVRSINFCRLTPGLTKYKFYELVEHNTFYWRVHIFLLNSINVSSSFAFLNANETIFWAMLRLHCNIKTCFGFRWSLYHPHKAFILFRAHFCDCISIHDVLVVCGRRSSVISFFLTFPPEKFDSAFSSPQICIFSSENAV